MLWLQEGATQQTADHSLDSSYVAGLLAQWVSLPDVPPECCVFALLGGRQRNSSLKNYAAVDSPPPAFQGGRTRFMSHSHPAYAAVLHQTAHQFSTPEILSRSRSRSGAPQILAYAGLCPFSFLYMNTHGPLAQAGPTVHQELDEMAMMWCC